MGSIPVSPFWGLVLLLPVGTFEKKKRINPYTAVLVDEISANKFEKAAPRVQQFGYGSDPPCDVRETSLGREKEGGHPSFQRARDTALRTRAPAHVCRAIGRAISVLSNN